MTTIRNPASLSARFSAAEDRVPFFVPLAVLLVYLLWRGYSFGFSDQDETVPYLLHLLNPEVLPNDWFVDYQTSHFGPRTIFVLLCYPFAKLFGIYTTYLGLHLASFLFTAGAIFALARELLKDRLAATASVLVILVLTPKFTLGGNDLIGPLLTPSIIAWSLALWSIVMMVQGRTIHSAVLAGLATWIQALVGLQIGSVVCVLMIWNRMRSTWKFATVFALIVLPAVGPMALQQLAQSAGESNLFYTLFDFRAPHHYMPTSFTRISAIGFLLLGMAGLFSLHTLKRWIPAESYKLVVRTLALVGIACALGFLCAEVIPVESVTKLQLFKTTVLAKAVFGILVCGAISRVLPNWFRGTARLVLEHSHIAFVAVALLFSALLVASSTALGLRPTAIPPIEQWATTHTPPQAVFAVPPSWDGFRSRAARPIVVNYKAFPFLPGLEDEWLERLLSIAPIQLPDRGYIGITDSLDRAFFRLDTGSLLELASKYGATYLVRDRPTHAAPFVLEYSRDDWWVYRIEPDVLP